MWIYTSSGYLSTRLASSSKPFRKDLKQFVTVKQCRYVSNCLLPCRFMHLHLSSFANQMFRPEELELLICGDPQLDFEELEKSAEYENGFSPEHTVVKYFWQVVHSLTLEQKKRLLFFCTGSDRAPIGGLGKLKLVIVRHGGDSDRYVFFKVLVFCFVLFRSWRQTDRSANLLLKKKPTL
jgi:hypothetical protein